MHCVAWVFQQFGDGVYSSDWSVVLPLYFSGFMMGLMRPTFHTITKVFIESFYILVMYFGSLFIQNLKVCESNLVGKIAQKSKSFQWFPRKQAFRPVFEKINLDTSQPIITYFLFWNQISPGTVGVLKEKNVKKATVKYIYFVVQKTKCVLVVHSRSSLFTVWVLQGEQQSNNQHKIQNGIE